MEESTVKSITTELKAIEPLPQAEPQPLPDQEKTPTEEKPQEVDVESLIPNGPYQTDPLFYQVADYFGIKQEDYNAAKNKLSAITEHMIRELKTNDPSQLLLKMREYEDKLEKPDWGERRYDVFYKYVRLAAQKKSIEQAMSAFERAEARK